MITFWWHFCGISLEAAISSITVLGYVYDGTFSGDRRDFHSFGQPRVGDRDLAELHDKKVKNSFRVVNHLDFVPLLPPSYPLPWIHHGQEIYYYEGMEIAQSGWKSTNPFQQCLGLETPDTCRNSVTCFFRRAISLNWRRTAALALMLRRVRSGDSVS
ncbi:hypothetical protein L596_021447 [Steinernema carpocapsae]|uniref:Fungal lipase-type domain-containing protein n=1 Tax=Steinernema carpocapsae TaxID=34508 RepID=A0A4U5MIR5_STECR|nr:hypothetical protein L596_021447 [Steinernema carpocapsae]